MIKLYLRRVGWFVFYAAKRFYHSDVVLLAGGVGYSALMSFVPVVAVLVTLLSTLFKQERLFRIFEEQLRMFVPGHTEALLEPVQTFMQSSYLFGGIGLIVLIVFASLSFRVLQSAMTHIFEIPPSQQDSDGFSFSLLIPYLYLFVLAVFLFALTLAVGFLEGLRGESIVVFGYRLSMAPISPGFLIYATSYLWLVIIFSSIYKILSPVEVRLRYAAMGGLIAGSLWEIMRRILVFYFQNISVINVIYGSLATLMVILVTVQWGASIILLGAQFVAQLVRADRQGIAWHEVTDEVDESLDN